MRIVWGLEAQGHIPTIETMLNKGNGWNDIGQAIGWDAETAKAHYYEYISRHPLALGEDDGA